MMLASALQQSVQSNTQQTVHRDFTQKDPRLSPNNAGLLPSSGRALGSSLPLRSYATPGRRVDAFAGTDELDGAWPDAELTNVHQPRTRATSGPSGRFLVGDGSPLPRLAPPVSSPTLPFTPRAPFPAGAAPFVAAAC